SRRRREVVVAGVSAVVTTGVTDNVGAAGRVGGDSRCLVVKIAAQEGGVREHRIDDQGPAAIVCSHLEADAVCTVEHIGAVDFAADAVNLLIDDRLVLAYGAS